MKLRGNAFLRRHTRLIQVAIAAYHTGTMREARWVGRYCAMVRGNHMFKAVTTKAAVEMKAARTMATKVRRIGHEL